VPQAALAPRLKLNFLAMGCLLLEDCIEPLCRCCVPDAERNFIVGLERPVVEVASTDCTPDTIDDHHFLVQQRVGILEQTHIAAQKLFEVAVPGVLHHGIIGSIAEGIITRTSTPRETASPNASIASGSGMK
jgi:hypothetical protein